MTGTREETKQAADSAIASRPEAAALIDHSGAAAGADVEQGSRNRQAAEAIHQFVVLVVGAPYPQIVRRVHRHSPWSGACDACVVEDALIIRCRHTTQRVGSIRIRPRERRPRQAGRGPDATVVIAVYAGVVNERRRHVLAGRVWDAV